MRGLTKRWSFAIFCLTFFTTLFPISLSADTLSSTESLTNNRTLVSASEVFEFGLFRPGSKGWYLGIWYKKIPTETYVWVANRDTPLLNSSATLKFDDHGSLVLLDPSGNITWSANQTRTAQNLVLQLLDSGNLVVREENDDDPENYLWQSFHYPTDTLLPGMKLGWDFGFETYLSSWKTTSDPSTGDYSFKLDPRGFPEIFLRNNQVITYRSGPWNGNRFSGVPEMAPVKGIQFSFVDREDEVYYTFSISNNYLLSRLVVGPSGVLDRFTWVESSQTWNTFWYAPKDQCDDYKECGPYGVCDSNASPVCKCLKAFAPRNPQAWELRDGSDGCVRRTELGCNSDKIWTAKNVKLPESSSAFVDRNMSLEECRKLCLENCSCTAYANADIENGGTGCVTWSGELIDIRDYAEGGQVLYVRLAAADLENDWTPKKIIIIVAVAVGICVLLSVLFVVWRRKAKENTETRGPREKSQDLLLNEMVNSKREGYSGERDKDELDLPLFDYRTMAMATNNFSDENKLGQGGFGSVYKGMLVEGQEIAVKRLAKNSAQGIEEFKNEVRLIAKLQHINLVRLLGFCIEMDDKMLIYEYMENRSLDSILFNKAKSSLLDWQKRFNIICGIARGLLYLHQDSRFRIIHRDLKASNILLDREMTPKISDFGMARMFSRDQTQANTIRVVGTYGYMSPEYAMDGLFSVKSDAFSFGVLVLEIVSGKKNRGFYHANSELNLLGHAWNLWKEGKALELVDSSIGESYSASEVLRCIQVGLLCVQERAEDRPNMCSVVLTLGSETATMPQPKNPGFSLCRTPVDTNSWSSKQEDQSCTVNQVTVTVIDGR
ncbi:Receptor-like serine/threonine-protein kinase SD1-8 [Morus notabilis]|uniref:Receptor-like serine/threonine-protein kinase n=1 Tax=Morus notabilis TaxID=981085 RepID=W9RUW2_9ROSA|nr:receptor-like serine/threonine-protein kinase SD1-8 [Morus notabilis]EXC11581.1 Receptor-like serine/threonine-protein kinase SD1-8 [Morus notabilis]